MLKIDDSEFPYLVYDEIMSEMYLFEHLQEGVVAICFLVSSGDSSRWLPCWCEIRISMSYTAPLQPPWRALHYFWH